LLHSILVAFPPVARFCSHQIRRRRNGGLPYSARWRTATLRPRIITFDSHLDLRFDYAGAAEDGKTQFDLPKVARGQLKGAALAVFVPQGPRTPEGYAKAREDADKKLALIKAVAEQNPKLAELAYSPADVRRIAAEGKFAVAISLLNAYPFGSDLSQIDEWYKRGVRIIGYVHAGHNDWADSSRPNKKLGDATDEHGGLSELGSGRGAAEPIRCVDRRLAAFLAGIPTGFEPDQSSSGGKPLRHQIDRQCGPKLER
jgi:hypothetical protein